MKYYTKGKVQFLLFSFFLELKKNSFLGGGGVAGGEGGWVGEHLNFPDNP